MEWLAFVLWFLWWSTGLTYALWAWARTFDELDMPTIVFAAFGCVIFGPIWGLLWGGGFKGGVWKRKK